MSDEPAPPAPARRGWGRPGPSAPREDEPRRPPIDIKAALEKATWVDGVCLGGIVAYVVYAYATYPLAAILLRHVTVHLVATGSITALLTGGAAAYAGRLSFVLAVVLGVIGLTKWDGFFLWAGRRYGDDAAHFLETTGGMRPRTVARAERWVARWGVPLLVITPFLPIPTWLVLLLASASGTRMVWLVLADVAGTVLWVLTFLLLGHHFHRQVDHIAAVINHYNRIATFVLIGVLVLVGVLRGYRQQRRAA